MVQFTEQRSVNILSADFTEQFVVFSLNEGICYLMISLD